MLERIYRIGAILGAGVILFLTITKVTLKIIAQEGNEDKLRVNPVEFVARRGDGTTQVATYKLPEAGILPNNPFYGFKRVRDWLWIGLNSDPKEKSKLILLLTDKKIKETVELFRLEKPDLAIEAGKEVIVRLEEAEEIAQKITNENSAKNTHEKISMAGQVHRAILEKMKGGFEMDNEKYQNLINKIDAFNAKQSEKMAAW